MAKPVSLELARDFLDAQFPEWADLPLIPFKKYGTDNQIFRLGQDKCLRFPKVDWAAETAAHEHALLKRFQGLPLDVPQPLGLGQAGKGYPWQWSVFSWVDGDALDMRRLRSDEAEGLAETILAVRDVRAEAAFSYRTRNYGRGEPLSNRDALFQKAVRELSNEYDQASLKRIWARCLEADEPDCKPVFLHGDLHGGNLVERSGQVTGIIDWGLAGVGDGACDLSAAWCLMEQSVRAAFQAAMQPTDAEWLRGAGWALSIACTFVAHYRDKPGVDCDMSRRTITEVLDVLA